MTTVYREIFDVKGYRPAMDAAVTLRTKRIQARAGGTWRIAKGPGKGELCFGPVRIVDVTSHGQVKAIVDGKQVQLIPYVPYLDVGNPSSPEWWITFEIEF